MGTKRTRRAHSTKLTTHTIAVLGIGCGINHMNQDDLRALWRRWGAEVTEHWQREFGPNAEPFCAMLAREEGWRADKS